MKLTVTKLIVCSTRGKNKQPCSGTVLFSDGEEFEWLRLPEKFYPNEPFGLSRAVRLPHNTGWTTRVFRLPKRISALTAHLGD